MLQYSLQYNFINILVFKKGVMSEVIYSQLFSCHRKLEKVVNLVFLCEIYTLFLKIHIRLTQRLKLNAKRKNV